MSTFAEMNREAEERSRAAIGLNRKPETTFAEDVKRRLSSLRITHQAVGNLERQISEIKKRA
jgi:hypothetical protein